MSEGHPTQNITDGSGCTVGRTENSMADKVFKLTRRRALGGLLTIGAGSAAAGVGTFALFNDTESSTENTLQAGTLSLTDGASSASFSATGLAPGDETDTFEVDLENDGSLDGSLDIDLTLTENDSDATAGDDGDADASVADLAGVLDVTTFEVGSLDVLDDRFGGSATLADVVAANSDAADGDDDSNVQDIDLESGETKTFSFALAMQESAGNEFQADGLDIQFDFELNQRDSQ